ncbi:MAG: hypothetical protein A2041_00165 [Bacteroidetes bacterium GWA2_31_9b]|nr:MAG: hypothetical protein A2041_00165 [Bacteroidetes bacterium GWA2_31_9b]
MKKITFVAGLVIISTVSSLFAQKSGVFKSYTDYFANKMEYGIDCAKEVHKIKLNDFWGKDFITVIHDGEPYDLKKAEIWGFQLCDEKVIRFQGEEDYLVDDKSILWIYSKQSVLSGNPKTGGSKTITTYYFSKGGDGEIQELTLLNLKTAFPENHKLHNAIDSQFKSDASLDEYDQFHMHYKINHFLESFEVK